IIRGGENISALEVEQCAGAHPAVVEAAAFALPDTDMGECVALVVHVREDISEQELRSFMAGRLAAFKLPSRIWFTDQPLPRNATGKLQKPQIRQAVGLA
ncbi:MAG TPA: long-chain fatty acid--CoA ligase, partial [Candidatus Pseudomonas excrementavium]|nr:long-chain fatty acid--CoA ligase [Candidatus Pseudomonas excrementavium]